MRSKRGSASLLALITATSWLLAGCSDETPSSATGTSSATASDAANASGSASSTAPAGFVEPAENITLDYWTVPVTEVKSAFDELIGEFQKAHPKIKIKLQERSIDAHKDALRQTVGTDAAPDLFFMWNGKGLGGEFINAGASLDLTKYYESYNWKDRFSEATLANQGQYGGLHGVPYTQRGEVIYYNKQLFEKAGITAEPTTYDELVAAADKLKAADITPIQFGGTVNWHVMRLLDSLIETKCGAEKHTALVGLTGNWASEPCVTEAFTELKKWGDNYFQKGYAGVSNDQAQADWLFTNKAAMALEGDWYMNVLTENKQKLGDWGTFMFPTGGSRLYGFSEGIYIAKNSKYPDAAAEFLNFMTRDEFQQKHLGKFGAISINKNVKSTTPDEMTQEWQQYFTTAKGVYINNDQSLNLKHTTEYWRIQNSVLAGKIDPADAGAAMQKFLEKNS